MSVSRIHHLNCGTMCPYAAPLLGSTGSLLDRGVLICHCMLVETDAGLVLIETGFGTRDVDSPTRIGKMFRRIASPALDRKETAVEQVRALGFRAEDVRHVVVTHLDLDHAGGISDFPWATIHVHAYEQRAALNPQTFADRQRYVPSHFAHDPDWATYEDAGDDWFGFRAVRPLDGLADNIALVPLFGHSRGHSGVAVCRSDRWLLHAGDAYFHPAEMDTRPRCPAGLRLFEEAAQHNRRRRVDNAARLRALSATHAGRVDIFCAHDPAALVRLRGHERGGSSSAAGSNP